MAKILRDVPISEADPFGFRVVAEVTGEAIKMLRGKGIVKIDPSVGAVMLTDRPEAEASLWNALKDWGKDLFNA